MIPAPGSWRGDEEGRLPKARGSLAHWVGLRGTGTAKGGPSPTKSLQEVLTNHSGFSPLWSILLFFLTVFQGRC